MKKLIILPLAALLLTGCVGGFIRDKVEDGIRKALPEYIGPGEYTVQVEGPGSEIAGGHIDKLHIEGKDVRLEPNLTVAGIIIDMSGVDFNVTNHAVKSVRETTFQASVSQNNINSYLGKLNEDDTDIAVKLENNSVHVELARRVVGLNVSVVRIAGRPVISRGDRVNFEVDQASIVHVPLAPFLVNKALNRVNPILDLSKMNFPVHLNQIGVSKGMVVVKGSAQFKPQPKD